MDGFWKWKKKNTVSLQCISNLEFQRSIELAAKKPQHIPITTALSGNVWGLYSLVLFTALTPAWLSGTAATDETHIQQVQQQTLTFDGHLQNQAVWSVHAALYIVWLEGLI